MYTLARDLNSHVIEINEHGGSFYDLAWIRGSKTNILCGSPRSKLIWLSARSSSTNSTDLCSNDFKLVWDTGKLEKTYDNDGKKVWRCCFCGSFRSGWNHTKAKGHVLGGKDVKICTNIPPKWAVIFCNYDMRLRSAQATSHQGR